MNRLCVVAVVGMNARNRSMTFSNVPIQVFAYSRIFLTVA
jgi:hypothetical protein